MKKPLTFTPLLKVRVWGGNSLKSRSPRPPSDPVGESWELVDHGEDQSRVAAGELAGVSLHDLMTKHGDELCGQAINPAAPGVFPLLLKIIEAEADLSVQVHPDDEYAGRMQAGELGKTEAWYVLAAKPGARVYRGLREGVTREKFATACEKGGVAECLHSFSPKAGEVIFLPAGTVHALGAGVKIIEIQQNSDTTYRVFDWHRLGLDGKPRELHIEHALAVTDFSASGTTACCVPQELPQTGCTFEQYIHCDKFTFSKLHSFGEAAVRLETREESFHLLTTVQGTLEISTCDNAGNENAPLCREVLDSALIPAATGSYTIRGNSETEVLLFTVPSKDEM